MGIHIANVWHLDLCLSYPNAAFKPALGELYKSTQFAQKYSPI